MSKPPENLLGHIEDVMHHDMERGGALIPDIVQRVDVALIHVEEGIGGELHRLMGSTAPLIKRGIQLYGNYSAPLQRRLKYLPPLPPRLA